MLEAVFFFVQMIFLKRGVPVKSNGVNFFTNIFYKIINYIINSYKNWSGSHLIPNQENQFYIRTPQAILQVQ